MHPIFSFTDQQYQDAFRRGYDDARRHVPYRPPSPAQTLEFTVNPTAFDRRARLAITSRTPLEEVYFQGWKLGNMGERTEEDFRDFLPTKTRAWRARPSLDFTVQASADGTSDEGDAQLWDAVEYELSADGMEPVAPFERPTMVAAESRDLIAAVAASEAPLRFAVAGALPHACREVVLTVKLGEQVGALRFPLR